MLLALPCAIPLHARTSFYFRTFLVRYFSPLSYSYSLHLLIHVPTLHSFCRSRCLGRALPAGWRKSTLFHSESQGNSSTVRVPDCNRFREWLWPFGSLARIIFQYVAGTSSQIHIWHLLSSADLVNCRIDLRFARAGKDKIPFSLHRDKTEKLYYSHCCNICELSLNSRILFAGVQWFFFTDRLPELQLKDRDFRRRYSSCLSLLISLPSLYLPLPISRFLSFTCFPCTFPAPLLRSSFYICSSFPSVFASLHSLRVLRYKFQGFLASLAIHLLVHSRVLTLPRPEYLSWGSSYV